MDNPEPLSIKVCKTLKPRKRTNPSFPGFLFIKNRYGNYKSKLLIKCGVYEKKIKSTIENITHTFCEKVIIKA
jgi:hypothetical protein